MGGAILVGVMGICSIALVSLPGCLGGTQLCQGMVPNTPSSMVSMGHFSLLREVWPSVQMTFLESFFLTSCLFGVITNSILKQWKTSALYRYFKFFFITLPTNL
jgi:hypothetical protein